MRATNLLTYATAGTALTVLVASAAAQALTPVEQRGKALFFDPNLSTPPGQPDAAFLSQAI